LGRALLALARRDPHGRSPARARAYSSLACGGPFCGAGRSTRSASRGRAGARLLSATDWSAPRLWLVATGETRRRKRPWSFGTADVGQRVTPTPEDIVRPRPLAIVLAARTFLYVRRATVPSSKSSCRALGRRHASRSGCARRPDPRRPGRKGLLRTRPPGRAVVPCEPTHGPGSPRPRLSVLRLAALPPRSLLRGRAIPLRLSRTAPFPGITTD